MVADEAALLEKQKKRYSSLETKRRRVPIDKTMASLHESLANKPQCFLLAIDPQEGTSPQDTLATLKTAGGYDFPPAVRSSTGASYTRIDTW